MNQESDVNRQIKNNRGNYNELVSGDYYEINNYNNINISPTNQEKGSDKQQQSPIFELDCTQLKGFLAKHEWEKADEETVLLMLKAANQEKQEYLEYEDIQQFSCADLHQIDRLWRDFSNQKFGFSTQYKIWRSFGGYPGQTRCSDKTLEQYTTKVGWWIKDKQDFLTMDPKQIIYDINAPQGHLPFWCYLWSGGLWGCSTIFSRIGICFT